MSFSLSRVIDPIEHSASADTLVEHFRPKIGRILPSDSARTRWLQGSWLGHPLHPMLTDVVIGCWTTAWLIDVSGSKRHEPVADAMVGLGVLAVLPTVLSGWADWTRQPRSLQRVGVVHAAANGLAATAYAASWIARKRGNRRKGVVLGHIGATTATAGGFLGGHLAFQQRHVRGAPR